MMRNMIVWAAVGVVLAGGAAMICARAMSADSRELDVVIQGGRVMDPESGLDAVRNVGIRGGKIVEISERPLRGKETIEARGLVVAPGFIDLHEHGQEERNYEFQARDGLTTSLELELGTADVRCVVRESAKGTR